MDFIYKVKNGAKGENILKLNKKELEAVGILEEIQGTSSRNDKEAILKEYESHQEFRQMIEFLLDDSITTGIKTKKLSKFIDKAEKDNGMDSIIDVIEYLKENNTGSDNDIVVVTNFLQNLEDEHENLQAILSELFCKQLKIGVTIKTLNKVYGKGTIKKIEVMLAKKYEEDKHNLDSFTLTTKLDGIRCIALKSDDGNVKFFTRQGKPILGLTELETSYEIMPNGYAYDGELLLDEDLPSDELFRKTQKVVRKDGDKKNIKHILFDMISLVEFESGESILDYGKRRVILDSMFTDENIKITPVLYSGSDKSMINFYLREAVLDKKEGIMINKNDGLYKTKRTDDLLKVKVFHTVDLKVIGYGAGEGKYKDMLGYLVVDYKGNPLRVGSGLSDEERTILFRYADELVGRIVEVSYFEESQNEDGKLSLRFPVFKGFRDDKDEPSYN